MFCVGGLDLGNPPRGIVKSIQYPDPERPSQPTCDLLSFFVCAPLPLHESDDLSSVTIRYFYL